MEILFGLSSSNLTDNKKGLIAKSHFRVYRPQELLEAAYLVWLGSLNFIVMILLYCSEIPRPSRRTLCRARSRKPGFIFHSLAPIMRRAKETWIYNITSGDVVSVCPSYLAN